jgi:hypothetical protein
MTLTELLAAKAFWTHLNIDLLLKVLELKNK